MSGDVSVSVFFYYGLPFFFIFTFGIFSSRAGVSLFWYFSAMLVFLFQSLGAVLVRSFSVMLSDVLAFSYFSHSWFLLTLFRSSMITIGLFFIFLFVKFAIYGGIVVFLIYCTFRNFDWTSRNCMACLGGNLAYLWSILFPPPHHMFALFLMYEHLGYNYLSSLQPLILIS